MSNEKVNVTVEKIVSEISKSMNVIMAHVHTMEEGLNARDKHIVYLDDQIKNKDKILEELAKGKGE